MAAALSLLTCLSIVSAACLLTYAGAATVDVFPQNCTEKRADGATTLDSLISQGDVRSDTFYRLLLGTHCLTEFGYVQHLHNVTFSGNVSHRESVVVTCTVGVGLAFLDVSTLTLEGLTVVSCGATGSGKLDHFQEELKNRTRFFYDIHPTDKIAVAAGMVSDFTVRAVEVTGTEGLGMLVVSPRGSAVVENSTFSLNRPPFCYRLPLDNLTNVNATENNQVGGGTFFIFADYNQTSENVFTSLQILNTEFVNNSYCGLSAYIEVSDTNYKKLTERFGYSLGAGGGLSLILAQSLYAADVTVTSALFQNNTSLLGGGSYLALFEGAAGNNISFRDCRFHRNGLTGDLDDRQLLTHGSGFYMVRDVAHPSNQGAGTTLLQSNNVTLQGCTLTENRGSYSAAINIFSKYKTRGGDTVTLDSCRLSGNVALVGAAMHIEELKQSGLQPGMKAVLRNTVLTNNKIYYSEDAPGNIPSSKLDTSATVEFQGVNVTFEGENNLIADNFAAAIRSVSSVINFHDRTVICNNTGSFGGAISLIANSYIVLVNNSHLVLENNSAVVEGGAVYVNHIAFSPDINHHDCFLFFENVDTICFEEDLCPDIEALNFTLELKNNLAPLGSLIFGSTLDMCPWSMQLKEKYNRPHVLDILYLDLNDSFRFSSDPTTVGAVTTPTNRLTIHSSLQLSYSPGELFYLNVSGYDHLNQSLPVLISSKPSPGHSNVSSLLGFSSFSFLQIANELQYGDLVPMIVTGAKNVNDVTIYLYATDSYSHTGFKINLTECRVGFQYQNGRCECEPGLMNHNDIQCNSTSMNFTVPNNKWVGPGPDNSFIVADCRSDFCSPGERQVKPPGFDLLCHSRYHRSGILCGQCAEGYSIQLGSHRCTQCQDNYGLSLIILFAFGGVVITFGILFLHITVSEGYLNSILFYTNVLSIYVPILNTSSRNIAIFVVVAWFNLDFGIGHCFFDGMTTLDKVALRLVFPFYLLLLMIIVTLLSKKSRRLSRFFSRAKFSAAKLFATILLMSYATMLEVCIELLSPLLLRSVDGASYLSWRSDPNQEYFHGLHKFLVILACFLLLTVVLPPPLILAFPGIAFSTRLGVKIKPVLDAFWAPFKTKFRFFVGLRLLLRVIPYTTAYVVPQPMNILFLGIFAVCTLFLQVTIQPFDGFFRNTLDTFFMSNIIMLAMGALYFQISITANEDNKGYIPYHRAQFKYFTFFVTLAYVAILLVVLWHVQHRFPVIRRPFASLYSRLTRRKRAEIFIRETTPLTQSHTDGDSVSGGSQDGEEMRENSTVSEGEGDQPTPGSPTKTRVPQDKEKAPPPVVNYSVLREPLLEEGLADLVPINNTNHIQ